MVLKFKLFNKINENLNNSKTEMILPVGFRLFHGSGEDFVDSTLRVGGYDKVLWTAEHSSIAQSYIPVSGSMLLTSSDAFVKPSQQKDVQIIQRQLGINYDYDNIEFEGRTAKSYTIPDIFKNISDRYYEISGKITQLEKLCKEYKQLYDKLESENEPDFYEDSPKQKEILKKWRIAELEIDSLKTEYHNANPDKLKKKIVNEKLINDFGYKPTHIDDFSFDYRWKLKVSFKDGLYHANHRHEGRLFIITVREPLKVFDYTIGEQRESDLTDVDYHNIDLFRMVEKEGFDGIKITDFAQTEEYGNYGHYSIGIFQNSIHKLDWVTIPASHPEKMEDPTTEYAQYLAKHKH